MSLRSISLISAFLCILSCSDEKKEDPAPVDELVGSWSVTEKVKYNQWTGSTFIVTTVPTATYKATIKRASLTSIKIETDRTTSTEYDFKEDLTVDWDTKKISVEGTVVTGTITDENKFVVTYIMANLSGYYSVERTYTR
jgi:hypothetical protein